MFLLLAALQGCNPSNTAFSGHSISEFFPLHGVKRDAVYKNDDASFTEKMLVEKLSETELSDGTDVSTLEHYLESSTGRTLIGTVEWSSETSDGVRIHGYSDGDGASTAFDPPVAISPSTDKWQTDDDPVCTETGGFTFRSELIGFEDCPVAWGPDWSDCLHVALVGCSSDCECEEDESGLLFVGEYWQVSTYGTAWKQDADKTVDQKWNLLSIEIAQE